MHLYLVAAGLLCLAVSAWLALRRLLVVLRGESTTGRVVGIERREIDDNVSFHPKIRFDDLHGVQHEFTSTGGSSVRGPEAGTEMPVRYLPDRPTLAFVPTFFYMWTGPLMLCGLGLGTLYAAWLSR